MNEIRMATHDGTMDKARLIEAINKGDKDIRFIEGLAYRNLSNFRKWISKERALEIVNTPSILSAEITSQTIYLSVYNTVTS